VLLAAGALSVALLRTRLRQRAEERIESNERAAARALGQLALANADFRAHDRDGNSLHDFWVRDVASLPSIPPELALADAACGRLATPFSGYFFVAMRFHEGDVPGSTATYAETPLTAFGFCAYPAEYGVSGRKTLVVNEGHTVLSFDMGGRPLLRWPYDETLKADWEKLD
jgi:hypothetical protein